jgi:PEP-CTERM motif
MAAKLRTVLFVTCLLVAPAAARATTTTFTNSNPIILPSTSGGAATATTYPSDITVSGLGTVQGVTVTLRNWTDSSPEDIYFELVGPSGADFEFLGGVGTTATGVSLQLEDEGPTLVDSSGNLISGSYLPTVYGSCVTLPSLPKPSCAAVIGASTFFTQFAGSDPNGTWSLYIYDPDTGDSAGSISNGWSLTLDTNGTTTGGGGTTAPEPASILLVGLGLVALAGLQLRSRKIPHQNESA